MKSDSLHDETTNANNTGLRDRFKNPFRRKEKMAPGTEIPTIESTNDLPPSRIKNVIARYRPMIEQLVLEGLIGVAEEKLLNDELVTDVFHKAYEMLPMPVRFVLSRETCLHWLMQNREPLLAKLADYKPSSIPVPLVENITLNDETKTADTPILP
ncbi:MAG: hypothetical protein ACTINL_12600 [Serratia proteamaculans]